MFESGMSMKDTPLDVAFLPELTDDTNVEAFGVQVSVPTLREYQCNRWPYSVPFVEAFAILLMYRSLVCFHAFVSVRLESRVIVIVPDTLLIL